MEEASNDPILELREPGGYTFDFKERERERERKREKEKERERERDLVHIDTECMHEVPPMI